MPEFKTTHRNGELSTICQLSTNKETRNTYLVCPCIFKELAHIIASDHACLNPGNYNVSFITGIYA